jgi:hypothetical protein
MVILVDHTCAGRELGYRLDRGFRRRHDQRSCV